MKPTNKDKHLGIFQDDASTSRWLDSPMLSKENQDRGQHNVGVKSGSSTVIRFRYFWTGIRIIRAFCSPPSETGLDLEFSPYCRLFQVSSCSRWSWGCVPPYPQSSEESSIFSEGHPQEEFPIWTKSGLHTHRPIDGIKHSWRVAQKHALESPNTE